MADGYTPRHRMRVSMTGCLRNAAGVLQDIFNRNERVRAEHNAHRAEDEDGCDCDVCSDTDWTGFYAASLEDLAGNVALLDSDPTQLFEFADLYALHGLAAAHYRPSEALSASGSNSSDPVGEGEKG